MISNTHSLHFNFASYEFRRNICNGSVVNTCYNFSAIGMMSGFVIVCAIHSIATVKNVALKFTGGKKKSPSSTPINQLQVFAKPSVNCCILCVGLQIIIQTLHEPITEVDNVLSNCNGPYETNIFQAS